MKISAKLILNHLESNGMRQRLNDVISVFFCLKQMLLSISSSEIFDWLLKLNSYAWTNKDQIGGVESQIVGEASIKYQSFLTASVLNYCWSRHWQWTIDVAGCDGSSSFAARQLSEIEIQAPATLPGYLEAIVSKWGKIQPQTTPSEE